MKQGGVISPVLFHIYIDGLLIELEKTGVGYHMGNVFAGASGFAYSGLWMKKIVYYDMVWFGHIHALLKKWVLIKVTIVLLLHLPIVLYTV